MRIKVQTLSKIASIKQTIEKVVDKDASLPDRIRTLFCEQGIIPLSDFFTKILTVLLAITGAFGGRKGSTVSRLYLQKNERAWEKWMNRLADALK